MDCADERRFVTTLTTSIHHRVDRVSIVRNAETEADIFGLNAAREPHGFASASMRLASYRKLEPTPLEEMIFYDHPSGRTRVRMSMTWAAENPDAGAGAAA